MWAYNVTTDCLKHTKKCPDVSVNYVGLCHSAIVGEFSVLRLICWSKITLEGKTTCRVMQVFNLVTGKNIY